MLPYISFFVLTVFLTVLNAANPKANLKETSKPDPGQSIYEQHCIVCHQDGLVGAPKYQNEKEWKARLSGRKLEDLLLSSIKGINAMPPRGTCSECSDEDLKAAIQYMLPHHD